jgi:hypothetical protein
MPSHQAVSSKFPAALWIPIALWLAAVVWASRSGALASLAARFMPGFALLVAMGIGVPATLYFAMPSVRRAVDAIGLHRLTLMHAWRIPAAMVFFYYGMRGALPPLFWILAGFGDLLAGSYAASLLWRTPDLSLYRHVHRFGFGDFVLAVGTGLTFTLLRDPRMALLTTLPMVLIPLFGVGLSGASHIVALHALAKAGTARDVIGRRPDAMRTVRA